MPFVAYSQDYMLTQLATNHALYASLHTAYSSTGTSELSGGGYARVSLGTSGADWGTASGGSIALSTQPSAFTVGASTTVEYVGFFDASTSGNFSGMGPVGAGTLYAFTAATSGNLFTAPGSSYSNGQTVVLFDGAGATIPSNFTVGTVYYIISASGATFELSATSGGSAITVNAAGAGLVQLIAPETFGSASTLQLTTSTTLYLY